MNHATERSLEGALAELKALRLAYGAAQRRCTASLQRLHARNQVLEEEVLQLRAQLAARDVAMAWTQQAALSAQGEALQPGRPQMVGRIEALMQRLQTLLRSLRNPAGSHVAVFGAPQGTQGSGGDAAGAASGQSPGVSVGSPAARSPERGSEGSAGHPAEEEGDTSGASSGLQEAVQPAGRQAALSARVLSPAQGAPSAQAAPSTARPEGALSPTDAAHDADSSQAEDDFIDLLRLQPRFFNGSLDGHAAQFVGGQRSKVALEAPHRGAGGGNDDDGFTHERVSFQVLAKRRLGRGAGGLESVCHRQRWHGNAGRKQVLAGNCYRF